MKPITRGGGASGGSIRGTLGTVDGSYGSLLAAIQRRADGLVEQVTYGDLAGTTTATGYDARRRPTGIQTYRAAPGAWSPTTTGYTPAPAAGGTSTSFQLLLQDLDISYDVVGNPTEIRDWRDPAEWPIGAKPVTRKMAYDDLYRVRQVKYEYSTNDEDWTSPYLQENGETSTLASRDHRRAMPSPHVSFEHRVLQQDVEYDWLGNTETSDDDAHGFYDRSLGDIRSNAASGKPYQLASASNTEAGGGRTGSLATKYDVAGNLTDMAVTRSGSCLPSGASCNQRFHYGWDEVGRLVRAQRWDTATNVNQEPIGTPAVDLAYAYDASDNRVLKSATASEGTNNSVQRHSVYVSGGQELRGAEYKLGNGDNGVEDYQLDSKTEVAYLFAHGVRLARVAFDNNAGMPTFAAAGAVPQQHVLINLDDTLGSTALVLDKATGELVESTAYLAFGGTESDYRPDRWKGLREDYRFTGKEEDVEVGLQYFGKRFLSPYLGRWVSADPLAVHVPGEADWNLYAYVRGAILRNIDPLGLDAYSDWDIGTSANENEAAKSSEAPQNSGANPTVGNYYGNTHPAAPSRAVPQPPAGAGQGQSVIPGGPNTPSTADQIWNGIRSTTIAGRLIGDIADIVSGSQQKVFPGASGNPVTVDVSPDPVTKALAAADIALITSPLLGKFAPEGRGAATPTPKAPVPEAARGGAWSPPSEAASKVPSAWGEGASTRKGVGVRWQDPSNKGNGVRIDKGNPNNSQALQQVDHVLINKGGKVLGPDGTAIPGSIKEHPEAHIPLTDWLKWKSWDRP